MPKTATVALGGRTFVVSEKVMGVAQAWRDHLRQSRVLRVFESLDAAMIQAVSVADAIADNGLEGVQLNQVVGMARLLPALVEGLTYSVDEITDLLFDYAPELALEKEWILANAYPTEAVEAFCEVLKLAYPTGALWALVRGSRVQATSTNLPTPNGASGMTPGARRRNR